MLKWWQLEQDEREFCEKEAQSFAKIPFTCVEYEQEKGKSGHGEILKNFAGAILRGDELIAPGYDGLKELTIQNAAYLSAWKGSVPVKLPFDEAEYDALLAERQATSKYVAGEGKSKQNKQYVERWQIVW